MAHSRHYYAHDEMGDIHHRSLHHDGLQHDSYYHEIEGHVTGMPDTQVHKWKFLTVLKNETILLTTVVVLTGYIIICLIIICKKRNQGEKQKKILVIKQTTKNNPRRHPYLITVVTGTRCDAGTQGFVQIRLSGKDKASEKFCLNPFLHDPKKEKCQRARTDKFVLFANEDLGELFLVEVELQSCEPTSWYLSYVIVQDVITLTQWYFPHHEWLTAADQRDCRVVLVAGVASHLRLLKDNFMRGFKRHHVWYKLLSHIKRSSMFNSLLSFTYCESLTMAMMCSNAITTGIIMKKIHTKDELDTGQTVLFTTTANAVVSFVMSIIEVGMVMMEHRNRFDHLEYRGTLSADSVFSATQRLQKLDSSIWRDEPETYYKSFNNYDEEIGEENQYDPNGVLLRDYSVQGSPNYNRGQRRPILSSYKGADQNDHVTISVNGEDHLIEPKKQLWIPGVGNTEQFRSSLHSPFAVGMPRELAKANDSSYNIAHDIDDSRNIRWNDAAELYVYSKKKPVTKGQQPFKAIVPVTSPKARHVLQYQPIYMYEQDAVHGTDGANYMRGAGDIFRGRDDRDTYRGRDERHPSAFRPVIDYPRRETLLDDVENHSPESFTEIHTDLTKRMKEVLKNSVDGFCQTGDIEEDKDETKTTKAEKQHELKDEKGEVKLDVKDKDDKKIQDIFVNRIKQFIRDELSSIFKKDDSSKEKNLRTKENRNNNKSIKKSLKPMISSFVDAVQESIMQQKDINESYIKDFESGIFKLLETTKSKLKSDEDLKPGKTQDQNDETSMKKIHRKPFIPTRVSSLTQRLSSSGFFNTTGYRASDTVLSSGHSLKKDASFEHNVISSDTACNKVYDRKYHKNENDKISTPKSSIADIHDEMQLGPLSKKLSDAVVGCAYNQNQTRVEKKAEEIINMSKKSRANLIDTLCKALQVNIDESKIKEQTSMSLVDKCSAEISNAEKKSSLQLEVEKVPKNLAVEVNDEHMVKTTSASLQSILSEDIHQKFKEIVGGYSKAEMHEFTSDVVGSLYAVVREKLQKVIAFDLDVHKMDENNDKLDVREKWSKFNTVLESADKEIKTEVLPVVTEHITTLIEEEAHTLETLDVDLMMLAYGGQFVDTVVTNAVLQTHVGLAKGAKSLLEAKENMKDKKEQHVDVKVTEIMHSKGKEDNDDDSNMKAESSDTDMEDVPVTKISSSQIIDINAVKDANSKTNEPYRSESSEDDELLNDKVTYVSYASLDGQNITGSNANAIVTSQVRKYQNLLEMTQKKLTTQFDDVSSLNMSQVLTKVFETVHEKLGHKSTQELKDLNEERKIHCALCKPKAVKDISKKLVGMTAAKYITKEVFAKSMKALNDIQEKSDIVNDFCVLSSDDTNDDNILKLLQRLGEVLASSDRTDANLFEYEKLIDDIVNDLTEYVVENACDDVAGGLISLMELEYASEDLPKDIFTVIERKVRKLILRTDDENEEQNIGSHNNVNYNAFDGDAFDDFWQDNQFKTNVKDLSSDLSNIRKMIRPTSPKSFDHNIEEGPDTTYNTYYYDDKDRYRAGLRPCMFHIVFVLLFLIIISSFFGTIYIGIGLNEHIATHWIMAVGIAILQHIIILEPLKILFLALFATYCGNKLL